MSIAGSIKHTLRILFYERSGHYQPILNLIGALGSRSFCMLCNIAYTRVLEHRCSKQCPRYKATNAIAIRKKLSIALLVSNRRFFGDVCFAQHKKAKSAKLRGCRREASVCQALQNCRVCSYIMKTFADRKHVCGTSFCTTCMQIRQSSHACFIAPLKKKKMSSERGYIRNR